MGYMFRLLLSHLQALKEYRSITKEVNCTDIYTLYDYMNNLYVIFMELSATAYGRDIIHNCLPYMIPCCYSNYFVSIGDPTVDLTSLVIGSVFFEGLKMTQ